MARHTVLGGPPASFSDRPFLSLSLSEALVAGSLSWGRPPRVCTTLTTFCTWVPQPCTNVCVLMSCFPCSQPPPPEPVGQRCPLHNRHLLRQLHPQLRELKAPLPQCKWFLFAKEQSGKCTLGSCPGPSASRLGARSKAAWWSPQQLRAPRHSIFLLVLVEGRPCFYERKMLHRNTEMPFMEMFYPCHPFFCTYFSFVLYILFL